MARPRKYDTEEELQEEIDKYFAAVGFCPAVDTLGNIVTGSDGKPVIIHNQATMSGLAYALGFTSRQSIYDYEQNEVFSYAIKRARLRIESVIENDLLTTKSPTGAIFWLKNHAGYSDKQEIEHSGSVTIIDDIPRK
jgi:hypothetical protein